MQETPNLKLLIDNDFGTAFVQIVEDGDEQKYVIHSNIKGEITKDALNTAREISALIDEGFKERGVNTLYTWAITPEQERYNTFLGYSLTGSEVKIEGWQGDPIFEYSKEL